MFIFFYYRNVFLFWDFRTQSGVGIRRWVGCDVFRKKEGTDLANGDEVLMDFLGSFFGGMKYSKKKKWRHLGQWNESLNTALARRVWCNACERKIVVVPLKPFRFGGKAGKGREGDSSFAWFKFLCFFI